MSRILYHDNPILIFTVNSRRRDALLFVGIPLGNYHDILVYSLLQTSKHKGASFKTKKKPVLQKASWMIPQFKGTSTQ